MKDYQEKTRTKLDLSIESEFEHTKDDVLESVRQQVEVGIFHLQTLFKMAKRSAESINSTLDDESGDIEEFLYDVRNTADLGYGITMSIWKAVSELTELQMKDAEQNEIEKPVEAVKVTNPNTAPLPPRQSAEIASLALQLSAVLNNQNLPIEIYNAVMDCVGDIYNKGDNEILNQFESSPEYLKALLLAYAKKEVSH